jgi:hypothetical protein
MSAVGLKPFEYTLHLFGRLTISPIATTRKASASRRKSDKMADAMCRAASLSAQVLEIEHKLGINASRSPLSKVEIELVCTDSQLE